MRPSPPRLRVARESAGLSRERAAVEIGRSYHTIVSYEAGRQCPPSDILGALAALYGVNPGDLYESVQEAA